MPACDRRDACSRDVKLPAAIPVGTSKYEYARVSIVLHFLVVSILPQLQVHRRTVHTLRVKWLN